MPLQLSQAERGGAFQDCYQRIILKRTEARTPENELRYAASAVVYSNHGPRYKS